MIHVLIVFISTARALASSSKRFYYAGVMYVHEHDLVADGILVRLMSYMQWIDLN